MIGAVQRSYFVAMIMVDFVRERSDAIPTVQVGIPVAADD